LIAACIQPGGRLPVWAYVVLSTLVGGAHVLLAFRLREVEATTPGALHLLYLVLLWMHFSITSRRLHDAGYGNWPAFLLYFAYASISFLVICPGLVTGDGVVQAATEGSGAEQQPIDPNLALVLSIEPIISIAHRILSVALILLPSESGPNTFGAEFGEGPAFSTAADRAASAEADEKRRAAFDNLQNGTVIYRRVREPLPEWGERKRGGFGRR
jgi:uncharacterized membrane protein YhaH (DUF805 family)